jgi:hypothetical protein
MPSAKETCDGSVWNAVWISPVVSGTLTLLVVSAVRALAPRPSTATPLGHLALALEPYDKVPVTASVLSIALIALTAFTTVLVIRFYL